MATVQGIIVPLAGGDPIPLVKDSIIIGRRPECDIRLEAANISGKHAELRLHKGHWFIIDLESTNGTKVNGTKIKKRKLTTGDEISIARKHMFRIDFDQEAIRKAATGFVSEPVSGPVGTVKRAKPVSDAPPPSIAKHSDPFLESDEDVHSFRKPLLEKAGLVHGTKVVDDDEDDTWDDDLDSLDDLDAMMADEPPSKPTSLE